MGVYNSVYPLYYILNVIDILVNIYIFDDRRIFFLFFFFTFSPEFGFFTNNQ